MIYNPVVVKQGSTQEMVTVTFYDNGYGCMLTDSHMNQFDGNGSMLVEKGAVLILNTQLDGLMSLVSGECNFIMHNPYMNVGIYMPMSDCTLEMVSNDF